MPKASILVVVAVLAVGANAPTLCGAWCAGGDRTQECHETLGTIVAAGCCDSHATDLAAVVGSESRQGTTSSDLEAGGIRRDAAAPARSPLLIFRYGPHGSRASTLVTVLRI
ncbi:MAG TPA: hypothetical protein VFZ31_01920 [Vicinamibacterales bacterium]